VEWKDNSNGSFIRNLILRTGLHPGRGKSGNGTYIGLSIVANNPQLGKNLFQYNSIDSTGYIGIDFRTGSTSIKNNLVSNFCMSKDDGAGIYTWGNSYRENLIEGNIVLHGAGCGVGTNDPDQVWAHGIYIDDRSSDINVVNNTIAYCGTDGVFIHNAKRISIQGNTLFANGNHLTNKETSQLSIKVDGLVPESEMNLDLRVVENRFVTSHEGNHCINVRDEKEGGRAAPGLFDRNYYCAPKTNQVAAKFNTHQDICDAIEELDLSCWQRCTENDRNSQFKILDVAPNELHSSNLIKNGGMNSSTEGWIAWPSQVFIVHDKMKGADGPALRVQFPSGKIEGLLYHAGFSLSSDKTYRLTFSAMSAMKGKIEFVPLMAASPWEALDDYACFSIDTIFKSFTYTFKPNKSCREARVNFKSNSTFWIDNVTLSEVPKVKTEVEPLHFIYNATANPKTIPLSGSFTDLDGKQFSGTVILQGYSSIVLLKHR
jgi:parallel beta-helix repeat protein